MKAEAAIRDWEQGYIRYRPLLLRALGTLARNGFSVPISDGADLIQDFFLSEWPKINVNYEERKGTFANYLFRAFVQFARPRIVRIRRWQLQLASPEELSELEPAVEEPDLVFGLEFERWLRLIENLSAENRRFLSDYLHQVKGSQRELAGIRGVSRYSVREAVIRILGSLVATYGDPGLASSDDWKVAQAIWRQKRTILETAELLGMSPEQVRRANARNLNFLSRALLRYRGQKRGEITMSASSTGMGPAMNPEVLLYKSLTSPGNRELLSQLRSRSREVLTFLDQRDPNFPQEALASIDEQWVAEVYEALAGEAEPLQNAEVEELSRRLFETSVQDSASIGAAFNQTLLPGLPLELVMFDRWFESLERASDEETEELSSRPDVRAAFPVSVQLINFKLTPSIFFFATEAVSSLIDRLIRMGIISERNVLLPNSELTTERLSNEIGRMAEVSKDTAPLLCQWLFRAAEYKPYLFSGFESEATHSGIRLSRADTSPNLYQRWGFVKEPAAAAMECA